MTNLLRLSSPVGPGQPNEEEDVSAFDNALREIDAYTPPPEYAGEPQRYLTEPAVDAAKQFQEQNGLKVDGLAKPGRETERAINNQLLEKPRGAGLLHDFDMRLGDTVGGGFRNEERDVKKTKRALGGIGYMPEDPFDDPSGFIDDRFDNAIRTFQRDHGKKVDGWMRPGGETETALRSAIDNLTRTMRPEWETYERRAQQHENPVQPAQFRTRPVPAPPPWPPSSGGETDEGAPSWRLPQLPPPPFPFALPGDESLLDWIRRGGASRREQTLIPPEFRDFDDLSRTIEPTLLDDLIVPMRGSEDTQDQNNRLGARFTAIATRFGCNFEHEGGGNKKFDSKNKRVEEKHIPADPRNVDPSGRRTTKGGAYGDIHLTRPMKGDKFRHVVLQTVDSYASGAPTARELRNAIKILRNGGKNFYVLLFPKLPEGWTFDEGAFEALVRQMLDKVCTDDERDDAEDDRKYIFRDPRP